MISKKVRLKPDKTQLSLFTKSSGIMRFAYNWAIEKERDSYKKDKTFIKDSELRKQFTKLKQQDEYYWLNEVSNDIPKQAIKDACQSYKRFFKGLGKLPKFKTKRKSKLSFYNDTVKLKIKDNYVRLSKIGWVKVSEPLDESQTYYNPRISFDGKYWYLSVAYEKEIKKPILSDKSLGVDLGIKDLAICSNGLVFKNINKTTQVKKLEKRLRRLQRKVSRKYQYNKKGVSFVKTCNIIKLEKQIRLLHRRLSNIRLNYIHQTTSYLVRTKPKRIVIEDLNVSAMMKNKHLSKAIAKQTFYEFRRQLAYKCENLGIDLVVADKFFPSTQTCSNCGLIKKKQDKLNLSQRMFKCDCGLEMDRDLNASINLANYLNA